MDKKIAITYESNLNQHTIRVYTDGSKLDGRVGAGFYAEYKKTPQNKHFSTVKYTRVTRRTTFSSTVLLFGILYYLKQRTTFCTTFLRSRDKLLFHN